MSEQPEFQPHDPDFQDDAAGPLPPADQDATYPRFDGPPDFAWPGAPTPPPADAPDADPPPLDDDRSGVHRAADPLRPEHPAETTSILHPGDIPEDAVQEYRARLRRDDTDDPTPPPTMSHYRQPGQDFDPRQAPPPPPPRQPGGRQVRPPQGWPPPPVPPQSQRPPAGAEPTGYGPPGDPDLSGAWPEQRPPAAHRRPDHGAQWNHHAQGSAANWNYTNDIRREEFTKTPRIPPARGWRRAVYRGSGKLINPGQSPDEKKVAALEATCRTLLRGHYKIGVLGKGGAGKSTTAAGVGSLFAELRQDDRVVAIDADTAFGKLTTRIDPNASGSYWELAGDQHLNTFADIRTRVGSNAAGLFVLGGDSATARRRKLDPAIYRRAIAQLDRHFTLSIVDCGSTLDADITLDVLRDLDGLIVVSSPWFDGSSSAAQTLEWLANNGYTDLLHRTVVVINDSDGHASKSDVAKLVDKFSSRGQKVIKMPYDEHLRPGGVIDLKNSVAKATRRQFLELAAACAEHFAATAERPRGHQ